MSLFGVCRDISVEAERDFIIENRSSFFVYVVGETIS
jgi:hypothetical protein